MDYFHYIYKHNHIDFNSDIYKVSTYHYNWHSGRDPDFIKGQN